MIKPDTLRQAIVKAVPYLERDPDCLMMWIDRGGVRGSLTIDRSFAYSYRLNILITDFAASPDLLKISILEWLRVNQPELLVPGREAMTFEADILDNKAVDLQIMLDLTENVRAVRTVDGQFELTHVAEPDPLFDDELGLGGIAPVVPLEQVWLTNGEKLQPDQPPLGADVQPPGEFPA